MQRKLVKQGPSTMTLSLPKDWIDRFNLKNGDEVDLIEAETKLIISSSKKPGSAETIKYDFENIAEHLIRAILIGMYKFGLKDIKIININPKQLSKTKEIISNSPGLEIIDSTKNSLHIIDIGIAAEETITKSENQIYWKIMNMVDKIIEDKSSKEEIHSIDMEINRLCFFIQRNLASRFSANAKTFLEYEKIALLESLGDSIRGFNKYSKKSNDEIKTLGEISKFIEGIRIFESKNDIVLLKNLREDLETLKNKTKINEKKPELTRIFLRPIFTVLSDLYENLIAQNIKNLAMNKE